MAKTISNHVYDSLPDWLTLREAAKVLGVSHCTIHNGLHRYKLPMEKRISRTAPPTIIFRKETLRELVRLRKRTSVEKMFSYDDSEEALRYYHGNSNTTNKQWRCMLLSDKYLRKPITPASRMARIYQIVERMKQREAA